MSESVQAVLALVMIVGIMGSVITWSFDKIDLSTRVGFTATALGAFGLLVWSMRRRDKAPDFLKKIAPSHFERTGFCFTIGSRVDKGVAFIEIHFQNRYERASRAQVVLQPARGFFLNRPNLGTLTVEIECAGGGFGVTSVPWGIAKKFQGKKQSLDVGAKVTYPNGRGKMIRYRGGMQVGNASVDMWKGILTVAAAAGGMIVISKSAKVKLMIPNDVEEFVDDDLPIVTKTLWTPKDAEVEQMTKIDR